MIDVSQQWASQIDVMPDTCFLNCSNCTRPAVAHRKKKRPMTLDEFRKACEGNRDFPTKSAPCPQGRRKVVGLIGGEPTMHPQFPEIVDIMCEVIPDVRHRGLWTSRNWKEYNHPVYGAVAPHVIRLIGEKHGGDTRGPSSRHRGGFLNWNMHEAYANARKLPVPAYRKQECFSNHQPILVAISDVVKQGNLTEKRMWELISQCWVQREWSSSTNPGGSYFCEVAGSLAHLYDDYEHAKTLGDPKWWEGKIEFVEDERGILQPTGPFAEQIKKWCTQCGACLPLKGRRDGDEIDDVSDHHREKLVQISSPRVNKGKVEVYNGEQYDETNHSDGWNPKAYRQN